MSSLLSSSSYFGRFDSCLLHDYSCLCVYLSLNRKVGFDLQEGFSLQRMCEGCWELLQTEGAALCSRPLGVKSLKVLVLWRQQGPGEQLESGHKLGMAGTDDEQSLSFRGLRVMGMDDDGGKGSKREKKCCYMDVLIM